MKKSSGNKIVIIGLFHLGSVFSAGFSSLGYRVLAIDSDVKIVSELKKNIPPFYEPGLDKLLKQNTKNITFSADFSKISDHSIVFFTQDTETDGSGSTEKLKRLLDLSIPYLKQNLSIIIVSQVPVGFHQKLSFYIKSIRPDLNFDLYHLVDTIVMTNAIERFLKPERIIIGKSQSLKSLSPNLKSLISKFKCPVFEMSYESAEITKAAINLYLATSVTYANTLSDFCENFGGNIYEIIPALKTDRRIGQYSYISPGLRISGGHLERDLQMLNKLAKKMKVSSGLVEKIIDENEKRYLWLEKQIKKLAKKMKLRKITIWGLSYKKNSTSIENAPSVKIIARIQKFYSITAYDPLAIVPEQLNLNFKRTKDKYKALENSDLLVLLTDWDEFKDVDLNVVYKLLKNKVIIDCTGFFDKVKKPEKFQIIRLGVS